MSQIENAMTDIEALDKLALECSRQAYRWGNMRECLCCGTLRDGDWSRGHKPDCPIAQLWIKLQVNRELASCAT